MRDRENLFRTYIYAPMEARIRNCVDYFGMTKEKGKKMCMEVDKARKAYHLNYTGYPLINTEKTDLLLNSDTFGIEGTAGILADIIKNRFQL